MKKLGIITLLTLSSMVFAGPREQLPLIAEINKKASELVENDWFSDEDAIQVSIYFLEKLIGPKPEENTLEYYITSSAS